MNQISVWLICLHKSTFRSVVSNRSFQFVLTFDPRSPCLVWSFLLQVQRPGTAWKFFFLLVWASGSDVLLLSLFSFTDCIELLHFRRFKRSIWSIGLWSLVFPSTDLSLNKFQSTFERFCESNFSLTNLSSQVHFPECSFQSVFSVCINFWPSFSLSSVILPFTSSKARNCLEILLSSSVS